MMGRQKTGQRQLFYQFDLNDAVLEDHLVRKIDAALEASQRTFASLFVDGSAVDRSGVDDPDAGRGVCLCALFGAGPPGSFSRCPCTKVKDDRHQHHAQGGDV
jgi:hypothetical protein